MLLISENVDVVDEEESGAEVIDENYDPDTQEPQKQTKHHFFWITNLNRLLYDQNKHEETTDFCDRCLYGFYKAD